MRNARFQDDPAGSLTRADISFPALLVTFGISILIFGSKYTKLFGMAYTILAIGVYSTPKLVLVGDRLRSSEAWRFIIAINRTVWIRISRLPPGRGAAVAAAVALAIAASVWNDAPFPIPQFYLALGIGLIASATAERLTIHSNTYYMKILGLAGGLGAILALVAVAGFCAVAILLGTDVPFNDEFLSTLRFILDYPSLSWDQHVSKIVEPFFVHRIAPVRVCALAQVAFGHGLDFHVLSLIGNGALFCTAALVIGGITANARRLSGFAPFLLLLFQPQFYQLSLWGLSIGQFSAYFFSALAFTFITRDSWPRLWLAILAAIAAAYSFAFGIFVPLVGLCFLIARKRFNHAAFWLVPSTLLTLHFFEGLRPDIARIFVNAAGMQDRNLLGKVFYFLEFLGSISTLGAFSEVLGERAAVSDIPFGPLWIARVTGAALIAAFALVTARRYWNRNMVAYGLMSITLLAAIIAAQERSTVGLASPYLSRYALYSSMFASLLFLALLDLYAEASRRNWLSIVCVSVTFSASSFVSAVPRARLHHENLQFAALVASNSLYQSIDLIAEPIEFFDVPLLRRAARESIYSLPTSSVVEDLKSHPRDAAALHSVVGEVSARLVAVGENSISYTILLNDSENAGSPLAASPGLVIFQNGTGTAFDSTPVNDLAGRGRVLRNSYPGAATHFCVIAKRDLPDGELGVALAQTEGGFVRLEQSPMRLPTVIGGTSLLNPTGLPKILHYVGRGLRTVEHPRDVWSLVDVDGPQRLALSERVSIETIFRLDSPTPTRVWSELWSLSAAGESKAVLRLVVNQSSAIVQMRSADNWHEISTLPVQPKAWVQFSIVMDHDVVAHYVSSVDFGKSDSINITRSSGRLSEPITGADALLTVNTTTHTGDLPLLELREIRVTNGLVAPVDW